MIPEIKLVKYRDPGMSTYTYFWVDKHGQVTSPYFDSELEANEWLISRIKIITNC